MPKKNPYNSDPLYMPILDESQRYPLRNHLKVQGRQKNKQTNDNSMSEAGQKAQGSYWEKVSRIGLVQLDLYYLFHTNINIAAVNFKTTIHYCVVISMQIYVRH